MVHPAFTFPLPIHLCSCIAGLLISVNITSIQYFGRLIIDFLSIIAWPTPVFIMSQQIKDDIERLSRGKSTQSKIGSRRVPHRLTQKERILFEAAKRQGFLKVPVAGIRPNVLNVYRLSCGAEDRDCVILDNCKS